MRTKLPSSIRLFEVGPRDGLQNEDVPLPLDQKLAYIEALIACGLKDIEVGAFVREDKIPQMAQTDEIFKSLAQAGHLRRKGLNLWALTPNERGLDRAMAVGCKAVAVFTGCTETFTKKNIGMTIQESLDVFQKMIVRAHAAKLKVRGYISVCWGCPYEGKVEPKKVVQITRKLLKMGVSQVSLGDTIGVATPLQIEKLLGLLKSEIRAGLIACHFHDTRGTALPNCLMAMSLGVKTLDASSGGLGGCNYAPGASGNVAMEDLVYMLEGMKIRTGVNLDKLCQASRIAIIGLGRLPGSRYLQAWLAGNRGGVA